MFITAIEDFDYKPLIVEGRLKRNKLEMESSMAWKSSDGRLVTILAGFITDLASLPWIALLFLVKLGRHQRAAVLHDQLYRSQVESRAWSDNEFNKAMRQDDVATWRRRIIYAGVRAGGWAAWNKYSKAL